MNKNFNYEICKIFKEAELEMLNLHHVYVGSEHLLLSILKSNNQITKVLSNHSLTYKRFKKELLTIVGSSTKQSEVILYTPLLKRVIDNALEDAKENNNGVLTLNHLLISMIEEGEGIAIRVLYSMNIDLDLLYKDLKMPKKDNPNSLLYQIGTKLNDTVDKDDRVIGREKEINEIIEVLLRKNKNNPLLIGPAGTGKTAIVEEITRMIINNTIPSLLSNHEIIFLEMGNLIAGTKYRGEFEERLTKIIEEASNNPQIILFIDEVHSLVGAGGAEGAIDASNILKPYLARNKIKCIGSTTTEEYHKSIQKDKALDRRFHIINIKEPTESDTINILNGIKQVYNKHYAIDITKDNIKDIVNLANNYIYTKYNPDKSIDLLDSVCAHIKLRQQLNNNNKSKNKYLKKIKTIKEENICTNNYKDALKYYQKENKIKKEMVKDYPPLTITKEDILYVISNMTSIPLLNKEQLINKLSKKLNAIIGQENQIKQLLEIISNHDFKKTLSILIEGPRGVGKSETLKIISETIDSNIIKLNMNEYYTETSINKLLGSPPGYVGYDNEYIFKKLNSNPYSIIIIDNISYAHPKVQRLFSQILDTSKITDTSGNEIHFNNSIIFFTDQTIPNTNVGFNNKTNQKNNINSELLSKIKHTIIYNSHNITSVNNYIKKYIQTEKRLLTKKDIKEVIQNSNYMTLGLSKIEKLIKEKSNEKRLSVNL